MAGAETRQLQDLLTKVELLIPFIMLRVFVPLIWCVVNFLQSLLTILLQVEMLQAENTELKQVNLRQKQLLSQTRGFLKDRAVKQQGKPSKAEEESHLMVMG